MPPLADGTYADHRQAFAPLWRDAIAHNPICRSSELSSSFCLATRAAIGHRLRRLRSFPDERKQERRAVMFG